MGQRKKTNGPIPQAPMDDRRRQSRAALSTQDQDASSTEARDNHAAHHHMALLEHWLRRGEDSFSQILGRLSAREREVLHSFLSDPHDARVARALGMSLSTVRNHLRAIEQSLQVGGRTHLAIRCLAALAREALLPPPAISSQNV